jgi:hypothetical protein
MTKTTNTGWTPYPHLKRFFRLKDGDLREVAMTDPGQAPAEDEEGIDSYYNASFGSGELSLNELDAVIDELSGGDQ